MFWQTRADDLVVKAMIGLLERNPSIPKDRYDHHRPRIAPASTTAKRRSICTARTSGASAPLPRAMIDTEAS